MHVCVHVGLLGIYCSYNIIVHVNVHNYSPKKLNEEPSSESDLPTEAACTGGTDDIHVGRWISYLMMFKES